MENATPENEYSERVATQMTLTHLQSIISENEQETFNARFSGVHWLVKFFILPLLVIISILTEFAFVYTSVYSTTGSKIFAWVVSILVISTIEGLKIGLGYSVARFIVNAWWKHKHYLYTFLLMLLFLGAALTASIVCSIKGIPIALETAAEWTYNPPNEQLAEIDKQISEARSTKWNGTTTNESTKTITTLSSQRAVIVDEMQADKNNFKEKVKNIGSAFRMFGGFWEIGTVLGLLMIATYRRYSYMELSEDQKKKAREFMGAEPVKKN